MITMMCLIKRKPDVTPEQFRDIYETSHVMLVKKHAGHAIQDYRRNYVASPNLMAAETEAEGSAGAGTPFDAITTLLFKDQADCDEFFRALGKPDIAKTMVENEHRFIARSEMHLYFTDEVT